MRIYTIIQNSIFTASVIFMVSVASFAGSAANSPLKNKELVRIVALGDSLTAGYQLPGNHAFPAQLQKALQSRGYNVIVMNSGVSGATASDGLEGLEWSLPEKLDAVILELGANDALRGLSPAVTKDALQEIIQKLKARNVEILITGMLAPKSYGTEYVEAYNNIFPSLAEKHNLLLYPFFLEGVALRPEYNLSDGMHPNQKGVAKIVEHILPKVEELIERVNKNRERGAKKQTKERS